MVHFDQYGKLYLCCGSKPSVYIKGENPPTRDSYILSSTVEYSDIYLEDADDGIHTISNIISIDTGPLLKKASASVCTI